MTIWKKFKALLAGIELNRKVLSDLAIREPQEFKNLVEKVTQA